MRIFVAGATGAIGRPLVRELLRRGHHVTALTRSRDNAVALERLGTEPVVADALDRSALTAAVVDAKPDVVVHQLTALTGVGHGRRFDAEYEQTNRLRTTGTDHLVASAREAGATRLVAQSYAGFYPRHGSATKAESDGFLATPPRWQRQTVAALQHLENAVLTNPGVDGIVLRYANLYGPGTAIAADGDVVALVRRRRFPVIGGGTGVWSFVHVEDAAIATALAIETGRPGVYNVADSDPAPVSEWLPALAAAAGAPAPQRVPAWVGRVAAGAVAVSVMTSARGADSRKAQRELGWEPAFPSWRDGFATVGALPS